MPQSGIPVQSTNLSGNTSTLNITAPAVVKAAAGRLGTVICVAAGAVSINDSKTLAGSAAANLVYSKTLAQGDIIPLNFPCRNGISVSAVTGTMAVSYS